MNKSTTKIINELKSLTNDLSFDESKHEYRHKRKKLVSATTKLKKYIPPFNKSKWLPYKAKQLNISEKELENEWRKLANIGKGRGNYVHKYIETKQKIFTKKVTHDSCLNELTVEETINYWECVKTCIEYADNFLNDYKEYQWILPELKIKYPERGLAGTIDQPAVYKNKLALFDWKTDKKFDMENDYGEMMLPPLDHLSNSKFNKYSLQLNLYKRVIEECTSLKVDHMKVIWFFCENENYVPIDIPDLQKEIDLIL